MITVALIAFRESLEILLIGGALYSALIEHKIQRKRELFMGAFVGALLSLFLFMTVSFAGSRINFSIDHEVGELLEGINYLGTGLFLFLTAIILHSKMKQILSTSSSFLLNSSLFAVGFLTVLREGMEIIFFSIPPSLSSPFIISLIGLIVGVLLAVLLGLISIRFAGSFITQKNLFRISDWGIKILSLYLVIKGIMELAEFIF